MKFELTNKQRAYLGLDPIPATWEREILKADPYRPESTLYFEGNTIKRHILSTNYEYKETQYDEQTRDRKVLLPKTAKGKEKKLTASVLESRTPIGVYFIADKFGSIFIGNHTTQTTFFSSHWERTQRGEKETPIAVLVDRFISESHDNHLTEINTFKNARRKHIKYRAGDIFVFKANRTEYGFGRIMLDVNLVRKKALIPKNHGLFYLMGPPLLVTIYALTSKAKQVDIDTILNSPQLPTDFMMDNKVLYGEYEIIGHRPLSDEEFEFPVSYGRNLDGSGTVFLQWGLIHLEKPIKEFGKYLTAENLNLQEGNPSRLVSNPYGYYSIGFQPRYDTGDIKKTIADGGQLQFNRSSWYGSQFDLRNPVNKEIRADIFKAFGLKVDGSYEENREITGTVKTTDILKMLEKK